ncbi:MAG TPA: hypothetical protein VJN67_06240 [Stellaceae bacterium]|nr:hypothetical protein [Stellaceae bacterium]
MGDRIICGWRVRSSRPLPETLPWGDGDSAVDIAVTHGKIPTHIGKRSADLPYIEVSTNGCVLIDATPLTRFLVTASTVVVDTELPPEATEWRAYLLGPVLAVICYLRGLLPLHASAVQIGGRAIGIAGRSGAGKSTLAVMLSRRGHAAITDDICVCTGLPGPPRVIPTYPAFRLSPESLAALHIDGRNLDPIGLNFEKLQLLRPQGFDPKPVPFEAIYLIEDGPGGPDDKDAILPLAGTEAFQRLGAEIYRPAMGRRLLAKATFFSLVGWLAAQLPIRRLVRRPSFARLEALADIIEADATSLMQVSR